MAEKDAATPAEPPKPVQLGGESFVDRVLPHIKKIIVGAIVIAVVLSAIFAVRFFKDRKHINNTERLDRVLEVAQPRVRGAEEKAEPATPSYGSVKERADAVLAAIAKNEADMGPAFHGGQLLDAGKLDEAITLLRKCTADKTLEGVLCRENLGLALEAKAAADKDPAARQKGFEEALAAFVAEQPDDNGPRRGYALYHQGRIQLLLGKRTEARDLFKKAQEINKGDSTLSEQLEKRLATLGDS